MEKRDFVMPWGITKYLIKPMENDDFRGPMLSDLVPSLPQTQMTILRRRCNRNRGSTLSIVLELMLVPHTASGPLALRKLERTATLACVTHAAAPGDYRTYGNQIEIQILLADFGSNLRTVEGRAMRSQFRIHHNLRNLETFFRKLQNPYKTLVK